MVKVYDIHLQCPVYNLNNKDEVQWHATMQLRVQ